MSKENNTAEEEGKNENIIAAPNLSFCYRLIRLQKINEEFQYRLAYLSTLGGAYHLCDRPIVALEIARKQEILGRMLGLTSVIVRSKVFQSINLALLAHKEEKKYELLEIESCEQSARGDSNAIKKPVNRRLLKHSLKLMKECHQLASMSSDRDSDIKRFVDSSEEWLRKKLISLAGHRSNNRNPTDIAMSSTNEEESEKSIEFNQPYPQSSRVEELP